MDEFVRLGSESKSGRELFAAEAASAGELPSPGALPGPYFACLVAWDASRAADGEVLALA